MKNENVLKNHICVVPFKSLEIHKNIYFLCCPSWLPNSIKSDEYSLKELWNSEPVIDIRNSILDGSYKYCDKNLCPHLSKLINEGVASGPIRPKLSSPYTTPFIENNTPDDIVMNFDRTCNYKCPSCRVDLIVENSSGIKTINKTIDEIDEVYSQHVKTFYITGTGDPFVSVGYRNFLKNFNPKKYPNLTNIHLHTNASMWDKEMWESMPNVHKYIKTCEISIDAATKYTYENKTRIGGNWDTLINNLKYINTIKTLNSIKTSFVVQDSNYNEMGEFYKVIRNIFGIRASIYFGRITNWGTFSEDEFLSKQIWNSNHPQYLDFIKEFNMICNNLNVYHNMHEFVNNKKTLL
jgi:MoaA/NifB/PqqE/SkfB family radical SAM enzyme